MNHGHISQAPTTFVAFGATGDLMKRKIVPALFHLFESNQLPNKFRVVGFSRQDLSDEAYQDFVKDILIKHDDINADDEKRRQFCSLFSYEQGDFKDEEDYKRLDQTLRAIDMDRGMCSNRLVYLAVPPNFYGEIFEYLSSSGLATACAEFEGWTRIFVEKPFGRDSQSAQNLDSLLGELFKEEQIYRIDHYLGKEMMQNILAFRFSNNLFEKIWNHEQIERIDVRLLESIGVETRGSFYDGIGALRDVGQNHLLQMLAFATMDQPFEFSAQTIREKRFEVLKNLSFIMGDAVGRATVRAQYDGYKKIEGVENDSHTETYFRIDTHIESDRWRNTHVVLEGGKSLAAEQKEIIITFRHTEPCLCPQDDHYKNQIAFYLQPKEGMSIQFLSKKPGAGFEVEPRTFQFDFHGDDGLRNHIEVYERLLLDGIKGDQTLFVSTNEVKRMWEFIDPIVQSWNEGNQELKTYTQGSNDVREQAQVTITRNNQH